VRGLIALGASVGLTLLIATFWAISYTDYINKKMNSESAVSFTSIYNKMKETASVNAPDISTSSLAASVSTIDGSTATSSEDESVKATTSSEDLIQ
jgi:hypothetical protein